MIETDRSVGSHTRRNQRRWLVVAAAGVVAVTTVASLLGSNRRNSLSSSSANNANALDKTGDASVAPTPAPTRVILSPPTTTELIPAPTGSPPALLNVTTTTTPTKAPARPTATPLPNGTTQALPLVGDANGVAYYHCPAVGDNDSTTEEYDIVLCHGSSFTKENWKKVGILDQFCAVPRVSVTALDLDNGSDHTDLKNVLDALVQQQRIRKPVVLVTPSASGYTIVDWLLSADGANEMALLPSYVATWVPVAPVSLTLATDDQITQGLATGGAAVRILAIYGDQDTGGSRLSARLLRLLPNTKVVELSGGHPVYLDSPDEFVQTILGFLGL
jgi:hypothetical protein